MIWHNDFAVLWEQWYNVMQINLALHTSCPTAADLIKKTFQQAGWVFYLFLEWKNIVFCILSSTKPRVFTERALWNAPLRLAQTCVCKLYFFLSVKPRPPFFPRTWWYFSYFSCETEWRFGVDVKRRSEAETAVN